MWCMIPLMACGLVFGQMKAGMTFLLSSPELEGRLRLRRGSELAVQWIAGEFAKAMAR